MEGSAGRGPMHAHILGRPSIKGRGCSGLVLRWRPKDYDEHANETEEQGHFRSSGLGGLLMLGRRSPKEIPQNIERRKEKRVDENRSTGPPRPTNIAAHGMRLGGSLNMQDAGGRPVMTEKNVAVADADGRRWLTWRTPLGCRVGGRPGQRGVAGPSNSGNFFEADHGRCLSCDAQRSEGLSMAGRTAARG